MYVVAMYITQLLNSLYISFSSLPFFLVLVWCDSVYLSYR